MIKRSETAFLEVKWMVQFKNAQFLIKYDGLKLIKPLITLPRARIL